MIKNTMISRSGNRQPVIVQLILGLLLLGSLSLNQGRTAAGEKKKAATGRQWAVLIGVEKYTKAKPLSFTINDVKQLSETLQTRGDYLQENSLEITDKGTTKETQPFKDSILNGLSSWLNKARPEDTILIYFSGHGFQDKAGKMYLAPIDCDPQDPSATGIPIEQVREQIAGCKAGLRVLVLDVGHAGSEKGDSEPRELTSKDLQAVFENLERVVTLASCKANEKSLIWEDKQQSLFSFWFNQGLKGHADQDTNGAVNIDELCKYVERRVRRTADARFRQPQSPVRTGVTNVHLKDVTNRLVAAQHEDGYWDGRWPGLESDGPQAEQVVGPLGATADRLLVTGHTLEWWAFAPAEVLPPEENLIRASQWLVHTIDGLSESEVRRYYTFLTHAGRSLALWRSRRPADVVGQASEFVTRSVSEGARF